tara:strand:+ start:152 stop:382 length:231 start_codon:yes stop_codon:yes gene_type:complete
MLKAKEMAQDPIEHLKRKLADVSVLFDSLQRHIAASNQQAAREEFQKISQGLDSVKKRMQDEFGWLGVQRVEMEEE